MNAIKITKNWFYLSGIKAKDLGFDITFYDWHEFRISIS